MIVCGVLIVMMSSSHVITISVLKLRSIEQQHVVKIEHGNVKSYIIRTLRCTYNESVSANILIGTPRFNYHLRIY
jgi:hypothetical protein